MNKIKKICVITAARSEYGLLKWLMLEIKKDTDLLLQIIVTGSHLSHKFGYTINEIEEDGFFIDEKIDMKLSETTSEKIAQSMGYCSIGISKAFERLNPDIVVILGDRYELLPIASTALIMKIPIAHISGGDITEGAIDDQIRHAVTKMSTIHFPGNEESEKRLIQMGENPKMVFNVGELGLDGFYYLKLLSREELSTKFNLDKNKKWVICTYHPETKISIDDNLKRIQSVLDVMNKFEDLQIIVTKSNADEGGNQINEIISNYSMKYSEKFIFIENLGQLNYLSILKVAFFMIGNSSSAIFEAPVVPLFAINMGDRQKGRFFCKNILQCNGFASDIKDKINFIYTAPHNYLVNIKSPYGKGDSSKKMVTILKSIYKEKLNKKGFYDLI